MFKIEAVQNLVERVTPYSKLLVIATICISCNQEVKKVLPEVKPEISYEDVFKDYKKLYTTESPSKKTIIEIVGIELDRTLEREKPEPSVYPGYLTYEHLLKSVEIQLNTFKSELELVKQGLDTPYKYKTLVRLNDSERKLWESLTPEKRLDLYKWYIEQQISLITDLSNDRLKITAKLAVDAFNKPSCIEVKGPNPKLSTKIQEIEDGVVYIDNCIKAGGFASFIENIQTSYQYAITLRPPRKSTDYVNPYNKSYLRELRNNQESEFNNRFMHEFSHVISLSDINNIYQDSFWQSFKANITKFEINNLLFTVEHVSLEGKREQLMSEEMMKYFDLKQDIYNFESYQDEDRFKSVIRELSVDDLLQNGEQFNDSHFIFDDPNCALNKNSPPWFLFTPSFTSSEELFSTTKKLEESGKAEFKFNKMCISGTSAFKINSTANFGVMVIYEANTKKTILNPNDTRISGITLIKFDPKNTTLRLSETDKEDLDKLFLRLNDPK
jgi:hypothetical protein